MINVVNLLYGFLVSAIILIAAKIFDKNPEPIFGIYQRRDGMYWFKVWFMHIFLTLRRIRFILFPKNEEYYKKVDTVQKLASTPMAVDGVCFNGADKNGNYLNLRMYRRANRQIDGLLYLKLKSSGLGVLEFPKLPDTAMFNTGEEESYEAEGIKITPLEPLKKWRITFNGQLRQVDNKKLYDVTIDAIYTSDEPVYNYDSDMDPWGMGISLAYEKWSRSYFQNLEAIHQTHYEQFGILKAKIIVAKQEYNIDLDMLKGHSMGPYRDWALNRRSVVHWITTENGDHFSLGTICQPISFSRLYMGFMYSAHDKKIYPIRNSSLELYHYGELGTIPTDYAFTFRAVVLFFGVLVPIRQTILVKHKTLVGSCASDSYNKNRSNLNARH